ncbi:MAG: GntR family transcriptional regulator, transcriptional repressor for pyruvate dehydrogenase complex [Gaiellales bacterium]|jgi:GntR family transcriptional repressor for pyruvate dehydrogenase complex|nr:GntR family transcriptional regulator, transcriptional repressor for pyruvate dehydrogenase complex [Gaiellales bacterium]
MSRSAPISLKPEPIDRRRTSDTVASRLLDTITSGALAPGDAFPVEREIGAAYSVGRSTVREALRILESQGVIAATTGGSFVVAEAGQPLQRSLRLVIALDSDPRIANLFELRRIIDCEAALLAAQRRRPQDLERMRKAIAEMASALEQQSAGRFIEADVRFHIAMADATGNSLISHTLNAIRDVLRDVLLAIFEIPESAQRAIDEHGAILTAIDDRDGDAARTAARTHLDRVEAAIRGDG